MRACRWPIGFICQKSGWTIKRVAARPACPQTLASRPNRKSRSNRSAGPVRRACRVMWCWRTVVTVLAPLDASGHQLSPPGRLRKAALAHRARLPKAQAGGGTRRLRRAWLARIPPSRDNVDSGLRFPDLRKGSFSPLRTYCQSSLLEICLSQELPTQRLRRSGLSVTSQIRSPRCAGASSSRSPGACRAARVVQLQKRDVYVVIYDTVVLLAARGVS